MQLSEEKSIFQTLNEIDITDKIKKKGNVSYLPWASAWRIIKTYYPKSTYDIVRDDNGCIYHTDGRSCWVETILVICDEAQNEVLPVLNNRNASITYEEITTDSVNKAIKRCLTKNAALFGLGLSLWEGEEISAAAKKIKEKRTAEQMKLEKLLESKREAVLVKMALLIEDGMNKEQLYQMIAQENNGRKNPKSIDSIEACDAILDAFDALMTKEAV